MNIPSGSTGKNVLNCCGAVKKDIDLCSKACAATSNMKSFCCMHILLFVVTQIALGKQSTLEGTPGHYPQTHCKVTNSMLDIKSRTFVISGESTKQLEETCHNVVDVWPVESRKLSEMPFNCSAYFKQGHAYTIYYWGKSSNYFHLTYDMMLPLYKHIYYKKEETTDVVFMPTVETSRLKELNWKTPAFRNPEKYWVEMAKFMARNHSFMPLDQTLLTGEGNFCFDELFFGTTAVDFSDADLIQGFIDFVKSSLAIEASDTMHHRLALVQRKGRRKILNEKEVVDSLQSLITTDLLEFSGMTFRQQVEAVQKYTVFAALNGAGLMNALYLPKHAVAIQMVPYQAKLNVKSYGILIKSRGPYLEWHNQREDLTQTLPGDEYNNIPNTIVDIEDFKKTVKEAISLYDKFSAEEKEEL